MGGRQYPGNRQPTPHSNSAKTPWHGRLCSLTLAVFTDASDFAIGAVLQQGVEGAWQPLEFASKKLSPTERKYSAYDRELLAIYRAVRHFWHTAEARDFCVFTDHKPVTFPYSLKSTQISSPRQCRHLDFITGYFVLIPARKEETVMLKRMFLLLVVTLGMSLSIAGLHPPLAGFP
jgi:hypothetical protein